MTVRPVVLTIAGSDSAGMAGIAMDLRVLTALGVHGAVAITANTAQDGGGVAAVNAVSGDALDTQLAAASRLRPRVIKTGLLVDVAQIARVAAFRAQTGLPLVCDPVLRSSGGAPLTGDDCATALREHLLPHCTLLTPNLPEAEALTGIAMRSAEDVMAAARALRRLGAGAVLIKGGHGDGAQSRDYFLDTDRGFWLHSPRQTVANRRGTGCALASAMAAALALGHSCADAAVIGKMAINQGLRQGYACGEVEGPVLIDHFPDAQTDLPALTPDAGYDGGADAFPACNSPRLGLYPIVDSADWVARLLPLGVSTIQLRIKERAGDALAREIGRAVELARRHDARLFINDHWELAIASGAYGVHLGQEDLATADLDALRRAGVRLGISTHCHHEAARAHALRPSYIACGPVYETTAKAMPWIPHGLDGLAYWRRTLRDYPLVAIGGISAARAAGVAAVGVDGVAMISGITQSPDPDATTCQLLELLRHA
ncbi:MAG: thiamine phosphate synthase [Gammaproteobacteria bacterium]|nr:thiamine phosphate synthase [Gammaproteobacteria bacterium]